MADIIAVANQKGGIAKTTTTVHLAHYAADELGLRVLLLDMDKQGSLSMSFPVEQGGLMASEIYVGATKAPGVYSPNISVVSADRARPARIRGQGAGGSQGFRAQRACAGRRL
ncbi:MAG: ParA family protein [Burkholderia gladioli]